ncbi:hypothetical protein ACWCOP_12940 [Maricaulaceae bacterium MS644]
MAGWALAAVVLAMQAGADPATGEAPIPDPCLAGVHGSPAELIDLRPVELPYAGVDDVEGAIPTVDVIDPCGLRFADLSGVWTFNGYQAVAYHDLRTGRFRLRLTHVPYDQPYFETWAMRFGFPVLDGVVGPQAEAIHLSLNQLYPPSVRTSCPDQYQTYMGYLSVRLGYDERGRTLLSVTRPYTQIDGACVETLQRFVTDTIVRTGFEGEP